jgi:hypothetical protein
MGKFKFACKRTKDLAKSLLKDIVYECRPRKGSPLYIYLDPKVHVYCITYWSIVAGLTPVIASGLIAYVVAEVYHLRGDDDFTHLLENDEQKQEIA